RLSQVLPGVVNARLDLHRASAEVVWDPKVVSLAEIARTLDRFGYPPHPYRGAERRRLRLQEERNLLIRMGAAWAVSGNVMILSVSLWAGWFADMDADTTQLFRWASMLITLPSILWAARPFFSGAWTALRGRALHMDLPIAIGLSAGFIGGAINVVRGQGEVYFDSVASLIFLLLVGRWVQQRQRREASDAAELLFSLAPAQAHLVGADGQVRDVALERLTAGDIVEVRSGETFPADGAVVEGQSAIDASVLTGESRPVEVGPGDLVHAGTLNVAGMLRQRVERTGELTRVGKLMQAVEEASRRRAPIVALADAIVGRFVAVVLVLAAITAVLWWFLDPSLALDHPVALLIVTCPCALGLATPLAVHAAVGRAARLGIFVKGGDVVERLSKPSRVWFDKTGTLTQGRTELLRTELAGVYRPLLLAVERHSSHPLARAVVQAWPDLPELEALDVQQTVGGGVRGVVQGRQVRVGSLAWVGSDQGGETYRSLAGTWAADGITPVLVAVDGAVVGALGFGDPLRPDAAAAIAELRRLGCQVGILSGDHPSVVAAVGRQLGIDPADCRGAATPEDKLAAVQACKDGGGVVMVGDGVNDAAALAAATVGISVHGGAEASLQACDAFVTRPGLASVVELLLGARRTVSVIKRNILFSLIYNLIGTALAMSGLLHPLVAAILMPLSSLTVVSSSFRSRTFAAPAEPTKPRSR
ncbi:MAG: cadmium-translocating P-type ATPase, partial [Candidatus Rokubacteria bacterium]|nr:cadmium-translocating P-type ATPase [Candidatus Rokubacteria bacterium]